MEPPLLADFDNKHNIPTQNSVICLTGKTKHHTMEDALSTGSNDTLHSIPTYRISHPAGYIQDPFPPVPIQSCVKDPSACHKCPMVGAVLLKAFLWMI